jgi:hypothetical protein
MTPTDQDTRFDAWLREALTDAPAPNDDGFTLRVMAALPPRSRAAADVSLRPWGRQAAALAMSAAGIGLGALSLFAGGLPPAEWGLAAASLLGLMLWWSLPQSAGSGWR